MKKKKKKKKRKEKKKRNKRKKGRESDPINERRKTKTGKINIWKTKNRNEKTTSTKFKK